MIHFPFTCDENERDRVIGTGVNRSRDVGETPVSQWVYPFLRLKPPGKAAEMQVESCGYPCIPEVLLRTVSSVASKL